MDVWYDVAKNLVRAYTKLFMGAINVDGRENLPPGPKIIVANHPHVTDGFVLPSIIQEKVHFFVQEEAFTIPFIGKLLALADQIPVAVGKGQDALATAKKKLSMGNVVAIFPEGRLSGSKEVRRAHTGAALLALETGVPLVPIGFYVQPEFIRKIRTNMHHRDSIGWWQIGGECVVRIGEPWQPIIDSTTEQSYRHVREFTDRIMETIQDLVQQASNSFHEISARQFPPRK
jgi:1-acyl-sn-glycerol-3-phosphate acyltransferase